MRTIKRIFKLLIFSLLFQPILAQTHTVSLKYHPEIEGIKLYDGIDFIERTLFKNRALVKPITEPIHGPANITIESYVSNYEETSDKFFDFDLNVEASLPWVDLDGTDNYNKRTLLNRKSYKLTLMIKSIYGPETVDPNTSLTREAKGMVNSESLFVTRFGSYFCSSIYKGHYILVDIALDNNYSSELENYFHSGKASVPFEVLDINIKTKIKLEVKRTATNFTSAIKIRTIGGPEIRDYSEILEILKPSTDFTAVYPALKAIIQRFDYSNAKVIQCGLSDYSTWGIEAGSMNREDILQSLNELRRINGQIQQQSVNMRAILNNGFIRNFYTATQVNSVRRHYGRLLELKRQVINCSKELKKGNESLIDRHIYFDSMAIAIKNSCPEPFDYLLARNPAVDKGMQFNRQYATDLPFVKNCITNIGIYNTINSGAAFSNLRRAEIINEKNKNTVETIDLTALSGTSTGNAMNLRFFNLRLAVTPQRLEQIGVNIIQNIDLMWQNLIASGALIFDNEKIFYSLKLVDQADRTFLFPFLTVSYNLVNATGVVYVEHSLPSNCCLGVENYEEGHPVADFHEAETPLTIKLNLQNLAFPVTDSLIIEVSTDNIAVNRNLAEIDNNFIRMDKESYLDIAADPVIYFNLGKLNNQVGSLTFKWYGKRRNGSRTSIVYTKTVHYNRKICTRVITL